MDGTGTGTNIQTDTEISSGADVDTIVAEGTALPSQSLSDRTAVSLKMLSVALPAELNETLVTQIGLTEPDWLRYGFLSSRLFGLSWTGDWLTLGTLLPMDLLLFGAVEATEAADDEYWFEQQLAWMTAHHAPWLFEYAAYRDLRIETGPSAYRSPFKPVSIPEAVRSPVRFDFLSDPVVSISLAANIGGALAYMLIAGKDFAIPAGSTAEIRGREYPIGAGIAAYAMEATYRSAWAGIAEEAFYRGYLLPELVEYLGPVAGIALNTAAFMLVHYSPGTDLLSWFLTYAPPSITFAMLSYQSDFDFRKSAFVHFWYDMAISIMYVFTSEGISFR